MPEIRIQIETETLAKLNFLAEKLDATPEQLIDTAIKEFLVQSILPSHHRDQINAYYKEFLDSLKSSKLDDLDT